MRLKVLTIYFISSMKTNKNSEEGFQALKNVY